jgi:hypothetical protein
MAVDILYVKFMKVKSNVVELTVYSVLGKYGNLSSPSTGTLIYMKRINLKLYAIHRLFLTKFFSKIHRIISDLSFLNKWPYIFHDIAWQSDHAVR